MLYLRMLSLKEKREIYPKLIDIVPETDDE